jgi:hypothetical protein
MKRFIVLLALILMSPYELGSMALSEDKTNKKRRKNMWGWNDKAMEEHWQRFFNAPDLTHTLSNLGSEWTRLDEQRGYKFFGGLGLSLGLLIGLTIGLVI